MTSEVEILFIKEHPVLWLAQIFHFSIYSHGVLWSCFRALDMELRNWVGEVGIEIQIRIEVGIEIRIRIARGADFAAGSCRENAAWPLICKCWLPTVGRKAKYPNIHFCLQDDEQEPAETMRIWRSSFVKHNCQVLTTSCPELFIEDCNSQLQ